MIPYEGLQIKLYRHKDLLKGCVGIPRVKGIENVGTKKTACENYIIGSILHLFI